MLGLLYALQLWNSSLVLCFSEKTSRDTVPLLTSRGRTTESKGRPSVEANGTDLFNETTMDGIICIRQQTNDTATGDLWNMMQNSSYSGDETSMWLSSVYAYNAVHALS